MRHGTSKLSALSLGLLLLATACGGGAAPSAAPPSAAASSPAAKPSAAASAAASAKPAASGAASAAASAKPAASGAASGAASAKPAGSAAAGGPIKLTGGKVVIGVVNDMTMVYADLGGKNSVVAAQMAVDDWKAANPGAISDISVVGADHQNNPQVATNKANELYDRDGVGMITDVPTSSTALAISQVAAQKHKLFINTTAAASQLSEGKQYPYGNDGICNNYTFHYAYDTYMLARGTAPSVVKSGGKDWYIIYPNYAFGQDMNAQFAAAVKDSGGNVLASDPSPFPNQTGDFSNLLLKAPTLHPQVLAAMQAGGDLVNVIKQYNQFKLKDQKIQLAIGLLFDTDIKSVGPDAIAGVNYTTPWLWSWDDKSKAWADKFKAKAGGALPSFAHAAVYSATYQYLEAIKRAGTDDADAVVKALDSAPINDMFIHNGKISTKDHLMRHDILSAQVKPQSEITTPGDYSKILATVPAAEAFRPESASTCTDITE
ncbi:MAG TPA: ABC transporter substrate-binding protein [Chloroflexota bacterium]